MKYLCWALLVLPGAAPQSDPAPEATFAKDVAPILYRSCTTCHRPGEIGPFPLITYEDARKRSKQILRAVESRVMPPWKPDPGHGEFLGDRRLADDALALLKKWVESGAPEGRAGDLPSLPKYPSGWRLGEPDLVLRMPEKFTIPAEGPDLYMHFVYSFAAEGDRYLRGIEVRPGNPRVAHHAIGLMDATGVARKLDEQHPGPGYPSFGGPGFFPVGFTPGYVPGQTPRFVEEDTAIVIKKGTDFVIQMHYHPTGKVETDQTEVGVFFTEQKPRRPLTGILLGNEDIDIPAGEKGYKRADAVAIPSDLEVRTIWAHMHYVGKSARVWAELPDGTTRPLLRISDWDFNWQDIYQYAQPFRLPKGTKVRMEFEYDNSADNPRNPSNPPRRVQFGEMSTDEMAGVWLGGVVDGQQQETAFGWANLTHYLQITTQGRRYRKP